MPLINVAIVAVGTGLARSTTPFPVSCLATRFPGKSALT